MPGSRRALLVCGLMSFAFLSGCDGAGLALPPVARAGVDLVPDAAGLGLRGSTLRIDFGRSPSGVIATLDRSQGRGRALGLAGCPGDIAQQRAWGGLILSFTDERFVGWRDGTGAAGTTCAQARS